MRFTSDTPKQCEWCLSNYWQHPTGGYIHDCGAVPRSVVNEMLPKSCYAPALPPDDERVKALEAENANLKQALRMLKADDFINNGTHQMPPFLKWLYARLLNVHNVSPETDYMIHLAHCVDAVEVVG